MHGLQIKFNHAMQLQKHKEQHEQIKNLTLEHGSNGSISKNQALKSTLSQELFSLF